MNIIKNKKYILIVANSNNEGCKLIKQWLISMNQEFISINTDKDTFCISQYHLDSDDFSFMINNTEFHSNQLNKIYFHRDAIKISGLTYFEENREDVSDYDNALKYYLTCYELSIKELTHFLTHKSNTIGRDNGGRINKVEMLIAAKKVGFKIPKTLITKKKEELYKFIDEFEEIITKSLDTNFSFLDIENNDFIQALTNNLCKEDILLLPDFFPLSIFQENVQKTIELRIFFIDGLIKASAIFSQNTSNTIQDYRNYDPENENRVVPFDLPIEIITKINKFQKITKLKTGSIDMILTPKGDYVFLEVNPQGQFIAISNFCNYYLDKHLAEYLAN